MTCIGDMKQGYADRAVGFVDVADRLRPGRRLGNAGTVDETCVAVITRAGVDLVQADQPQFLPPLATIRKMTMNTIATAWYITRLRISS